MSDASESSDIKEEFMENENKVDIEETSVNLDCVKNEPNEALGCEGDSHRATQYRITLKYENIFGESSHQINIEEDSDNLIGFLDNDVIMENAMIKLEAIKEEDDRSLNNFHCSKCKGIYKGYCLKCSTLLHILNNNLPFVNSKPESNTIPTDILEIREISIGKGVYLLRTLPTDIIFGPFEGISGIESTVEHSWKIIDNKLSNFKFGNWMKHINCAASALLRNLDIFQIDRNLYFQTNREITEGEELLTYYSDEKLQRLDNSEDCLYTPNKLEKLPKIFACTMCCFGFGSNKCLMEHKRKCRWIEHSRNMKDVVLIECHYCKMWMEKWEHAEYHVAYCFEKHHRMWSVSSEAVDRTDIEEMADGGMKDGKRTYQRDICSRPKDRRNNLQFDTKDYQCSSRENHATSLNECSLGDRSNNEQVQNTVETDNESRLQNHLNKHRGIKQFQCDICMVKFTRIDSLKKHIRNKHADDGSSKYYKCSECSYQTNYKSVLEIHLNKHRGITFTCDICMKEFTQKDNLSRHIKNKHTDGGVKHYKCSKCSYQTNVKSDFQNHLNKHRGIKPFKCGICMMTFTKKDGLKMHMKNKHTDDKSVKDYKCSECCYQTIYEANLRRHLGKHKGIKPFQCDICMTKFTEKYSLKMHIKNKHTDGESTKDYTCLECSYQSNFKTNFQTHMNKHRGIKPFQCDSCLLKFTEKCSLTRHIKNMHIDDESAKDYRCLECSYRSNSKTNFQNHMNKHRGIKPSQCDICLMKFSEKCSLTRHIKNKHTDDKSDKDYTCLECSYLSNSKTNFQMHMNKHRCIKPFNCDICMMKFTCQSSVNRHIKNKHTDDESAKDYTCLECSYRSNSKTNFQMHMNKHRCIKSFNCDICMMKFTCQSSVNRHIKNKHTYDESAKDYQCLECSFETNYKFSLQMHMNKHRGIKQYQCDICMIKFTRKYSLKTHINDKHKDDERA